MKADLDQWLAHQRHQRDSVAELIATSVLATLRKGITKLEQAGYAAAAFVLTPADWEQVELSLSTVNAVEHLSLPYDPAARRRGVRIGRRWLMRPASGIVGDRRGRLEPTTAVSMGGSENATADCSARTWCSPGASPVTRQAYSALLAWCHWAIPPRIKDTAAGELDCECRPRVNQTWPRGCLLLASRAARGSGAGVRRTGRSFWAGTASVCPPRPPVRVLVLLTFCILTAAVGGGAPLHTDAVVSVTTPSICSELPEKRAELRKRGACTA